MVTVALSSSYTGLSASAERIRAISPDRSQGCSLMGGVARIWRTFRSVSAIRPSCSTIGPFFGTVTVWGMVDTEREEIDQDGLTARERSGGGGEFGDLLVCAWDLTPLVGQG
ncbi:hypothetical protein [Streptomyces sp. NEAU-S7GS2]|uniref:hypothetical protein n=1 Tax=Streptomyces sp. NEAU-S7GS2 TaxID=2202000 RepID=UPI0013A552E3|nr:hypothetical protein [Streptomyces sp. NEAU-S7GS2]